MHCVMQTEGLDEAAREILESNLEERRKMEQEIRELRQKSVSVFTLIPASSSSYACAIIPALRGNCQYPAMSHILCLTFTYTTSQIEYHSM